MDKKSLPVPETARSEEIITEEVKELLGSRPFIGYTHVKVNEEEGFSITDFVGEKFDMSYPLLVARHRYGSAEQAHFHVQGYLKEGIGRKDVHSTYDHPAKRRKGKGSKPFKMKKEHYDGADAMGFLYMLKPTEALEVHVRPRDDLVILTNFEEEEIEKIILWSKELYDMKKRTISHILSLMPLGVSPSAFHMRATEKVLDSLMAEGKQFHNGIRHQILTAMYARDKSLREFVIQKYL